MWMTLWSIGCSRGAQLGGKNMAEMFTSLDVSFCSFGWPGTFSSTRKVFSGELDLFVNYFTFGTNSS